MVHPRTQRLIDIWRAHRPGGRQGLPARTDFSPMELGGLLPQVFMLGRTADRAGAPEERFRLSGGLIANLHGGDLKGRRFADLWAAGEADRLIAALHQARRTATPVIAVADARDAHGVGVGLELSLCPLLGPTGEADRTIGLYQPLGALARLAGRTVASLSLRSLQPLDAPARTGPRLVAQDGRRVA